MVLDIAVILILAVAMVQGFRNGFVYTFLHMTGWLLSLIVSFVLSPKARIFLLENTDYYDSIHDAIVEKFSSAIDASDFFANGFPKILQNAAERMSLAAADSLADSMTELIFTILSLLAVTFLAKLILWLVIGLFSKKHVGGLTAFLDGTAGLCAGFVKGMLVVSVLLALMLPVTALASEQFALTFQGWLADSSFACDLYDNNLILLIVRDFIL